MNFPEFFLICFGVGTLWALVSLLLGGLHFGHFGHAHHGPVAGGKVMPGHGPSHNSHLPGWMASLLNPSCLAVFLAWFGGAGYLLTKYSGLLLWINLALAAAFGLVGAWILAWFLRWLMRHERVMDPADYDMVGVLGRVSSTIRADGVGEVIYQRDGVRRLLCAKSESGVAIARGEEVIVTHFEKGIAHVRTWEAMTQRAGENQPERIA
jgi:membrane protein implicated in regulation of membrane protease activity